MIRLTPYKDSDYIFLDYQLNDEQSRFTSSIHQCKEEGVFTDDQKSIISILYDDIPVGFFILDKAQENQKCTISRSSILLRSFSINPSFQGKGLGKKSMLLLTDYMDKNFPHIKEITLSVNIKNKNAYYTYLKSGFIDTEKYIDGIMGPQHILSKNVK
ncbi:MAG: GNAT family N-acetyltransferase [Myroides sp.]